MKYKATTIRRFMSLISAVIAIFLITGCSTSNRGTVSALETNNRADQTFSFYKDENGKNVRWEVNFNDGEISSLYKDGERIPDNEVEDYKEMIYNRLERLQSKSHHITVDLSGFKSDMGRFKEEMKKLKRELKDHKYEFNFDNEEFRGEMKELSKELSKLKDKKIRIDFDSDKFREEMKKLKKDINIQIDIDTDKLNESLEKMNEELDKHRDELSHISIDLSGLDEAMSHLDTNLGHVKINLEGLDIKLKMLNSFIDDIKKEMVKDNLLKDENEKLTMDLSENGMKVNGKEVSPELFSKYKKMYEDHFDKKLSDDNHFRITD